jgi:hypothetical protein
VPVLGMRVTCANRWSESSGVLAMNVAKSSRTASMNREEPGPAVCIPDPYRDRPRPESEFTVTSGPIPPEKRTVECLGTQYFALKHPTTFRSRSSK